MKYSKFIIRSYRGITSEVVLDFEKSSLIPIIGINESGKTTLLRAIQAFDRFNDEDNNGDHLKVTENLYSTENSDLLVEAYVHISKEGFMGSINEVRRDLERELKDAKTAEEKSDISTTLLQLAEYEKVAEQMFEGPDGFWKCTIGRDLKNMEYYFVDLSQFDDIELNDRLISEMVRYLPYILYFDDFRDRIDDKLEITGKDSSPWLPIIDRLFKQTNESYSLYKLPSRAEGIRKSIISEVEEKLNEELTKEWANFSIKQIEPLSIKIDYLSSEDKHYIEFSIVEKIKVDGKLRERHFKLKDRSKGFYWYFNFIMKLVFNPKVRDVDDKDTVYLLDEPGSYLHSTAQIRLTDHLKQLSKRNNVIYCTHSPYLLNPKIIPINHIKVAEKDTQGNVELKSIFETKSKITKKNSAFQPILDALEVKPNILDYDLENIVLVEGMYDYLSFEMFKNGHDLHFFPSANAESIIHHISYMFFLKKKFIAVWDNDPEGVAQRDKALKYFGDYGKDRLLLLPNITKKKKTRLEDLYHDAELIKYRDANHLAPNLSFEKIVMHLHYNEKRTEILKSIFPHTNENFKVVFDEILKSFIPHSEE